MIINIIQKVTKQHEETKNLFYLGVSVFILAVSIAQINLKNYMSVESATAYWPAWLAIFTWIGFKFYKLK